LPRAAAVLISGSKIGGSADRIGEIGDCLLMVILLQINHPAGVQRKMHLGFELQGAIVIGERVGILL
jgi:hypothetical protein